MLGQVVQVGCWSVEDTTGPQESMGQEWPAGGVSGGHAGATGPGGGDQSRDASGVTQRQAWSVGTTLGWNGQVTLASGRHDGFRGQWVVWSAGNTVGWTNGGHSSRAASGVTLRQLVDHWDWRGQRGPLRQAVGVTAGWCGQWGHAQSGRWGHSQAGRQKGPHWQRPTRGRTASGSQGLQDQWGHAG